MHSGVAPLLVVWRVDEASKRNPDLQRGLNTVEDGLSTAAFQARLATRRDRCAEANWRHLEAELE
jgi:hypothetical protein